MAEVFRGGVKIFQNLLIYLQMNIIKLRIVNPFLSQTKSPVQTQEKVLLELIHKNMNTRFGQHYKFDSLGTVDQYRQAVPIHYWEDIESWMQKENDCRAVVDEPPVMYSQTSGTTGQPKNIPLTRKFLSELKRGQQLTSYFQYKNVPGIYSGSFAIVTGPKVEGVIGSGKCFGSMSGLIGDCMPASVKAKYIIPPEVFEVQNYQLKYMLILAFCLSKKDITFFASANPTTFLKMQELLGNNFESVLEFLKTRDTSFLTDKSDLIPEGLIEKLEITDERLTELGGLAGKWQELDFAMLWPNLKALGTWTGGNCKTLLPKIKSLLPTQCRVIDLGYISSEFRGGVNIDFESNSWVPTIYENFFEFMEGTEVGSADQKLLGMNDLEIGKQYYVVVTTWSGLYRYFINDIVEVVGKFNSLPAFVFVQKGKGVTNLTGEKVTEHQIIESLNLLKDKLKDEFDFWILVAREEKFGYVLFIEMEARDGFEGMVDEALMSLNIEYKAKRQSSRLNPLEVKFLKPGCGEAYKIHCLESGQRESQYKFVRLQYASQMEFDFGPYEAGRNEN